MQQAGCLGWPERWRDIYDAAMDDFDRNGCPLTDPAYYDALAAEYGVLEVELDTYKQAAAEVGGSEVLSRVLHLLVTALQQEEFNKPDTTAFKLPYPPKSEPWLGRDMLGGLALCSQIPRCARRLRQRKLPEDIILDALRRPLHIDVYRDHHNGLPGNDLLDWHQFSIAGELFPMGRLDLQYNYPFTGTAKVFRNKSGDIVALAHDLPVHRSGIALGARGFEDEDGSWQADVTQTDSDWIGYPFGPDGLVQKKPVHLAKNEWELVLQKGDTVIQLHIPGGSKLDMDAVSESIQRMRDFTSAYYPEYKYKAFACASWMLNPKLADLLGEHSNIVKFGRLFHPLTMKIHGTGVFYFVFMQPGYECDVAALPTNTRLEKALKEYYLSGNFLHETNGYFF
ncbi:MAG: hypothetical protein IJA11_07350 [Oscillospiraceae bacterium]|nr:hypothetical protein [Oscillospiraceae bacterium]